MRWCSLRTGMGPPSSITDSEEEPRLLPAFEWPSPPPATSRGRRQGRPTGRVCRYIDSWMDGQGGDRRRLTCRGHDGSVVVLGGARGVVEVGLQDGRQAAAARAVVRVMLRQRPPRTHRAVAAIHHHHPSCDTHAQASGGRSQTTRSDQAVSEEAFEPRPQEAMSAWHGRVTACLPSVPSSRFEGVEGRLSVWSGGCRT